MNIKKAESMNNELQTSHRKCKDEIITKQLTLLIQIVNCQDDLENARDKIAEQLIELREFVQKY